MVPSRGSLPELLRRTFCSRNSFGTFCAQILAVGTRFLKFNAPGPRFLLPEHLGGTVVPSRGSLPELFARKFLLSGFVF